MAENGILWRSRPKFTLIFDEAMNFALKFLSSLSSDPLFSCIVTLYVLVLLYLPRVFFKITLSPVFIIAEILLLSLLRLGSFHLSEPETIEIVESNENGETKGTQRTREIDLGSAFELNPSFEENFVEWNVSAPLEVIYEAYEDEGEDCEPGERDSTRVTAIERFPSLSLCYPETDTDSDSDSVMGYWFPQERSREEENKEGLIEIALDHHDCENDDDEDYNCRKKMDLDLQGEEENLIEIDISSPIMDN